MENFFGGTQTWTITMVKALRELGHTTHFTGINNKINPNFEEHYQPLLPKYDLLIANGNQSLKKFSNKAPVKLFVSHGILSPEDKPTTSSDIMVAISEETRDNMIKRGFKCDGILRNPIDLSKFSTLNQSTDIKTIGFLDRRRKFPFINQLKSNFDILEIGNPPNPNIKDELDKCDLVVARGRGAYEAMALSKNVIISGNNSGRGGKTEWMDGFVDDTTFYKYRENNCSGRYNKTKVTDVNIFLEQLNKANIQQGIRNRILMEKNNDSKLIANQILELYENFLNNDKS